MGRRTAGNNLQEMPVLGALPELKLLELHKNSIKAIPEDFFQGLPSLSRLVLSNNQVGARARARGLHACTHAFFL